SFVRVLAELLETRIIAEIVPIGINAQKRRCQHRTCIGNAQQMLHSGDRFFLLAEMSLDAREGVFITGAEKSVLRCGQRGNRLLDMRKRSSLVAKPGLSPGQLVQKLSIVRLSTQQLIHRLLRSLVSCVRFGKLTGMSLHITEGILEASNRIAQN